MPIVRAFPLPVHVLSIDRSPQCSSGRVRTAIRCTGNDTTCVPVDRRRRGRIQPLKRASQTGGGTGGGASPSTSGTGGGVSPSTIMGSRGESML
eukprot:6472451-Pyramimonas_sp.AAC.1